MDLEILGEYFRFRSAALDGSHDVDPIAVSDCGSRPVTAWNHCRVDCHRYAGFPVADLAYQVGQAGLAGEFVCRPIQDDPHLLLLYALPIHGFTGLIAGVGWNRRASNGCHSGAGSAPAANARTASAVSADSRMPLR